MKLFKREQALREKLNNVLSLVRNHHSRLLYIKQRLKAREQILFEKLKLSNNNDFSKILANEIAEIRKLQSNLENLILALESFILRTETLLTLDEFAQAMNPIPRMISSIKDEASKVSPYLGKEIQELMDNIENIRVYYPESNILEISLSEEAEAILREAAEFASNNVAKKLPEIPLASQDKKVTHEELLEAEGYGIVKSSMREINPFEDKLMRYIIEHKGKIDIKKCSEELGISQTQLNKLLDDLIRQGKIQRLK